MPRRSALLTAWARPDAIHDFSVAEWEDTLRAASAKRCLARIGYRIEDAGCAHACPSPAWDLLTAARYYPSFFHVQVARETRHVQRILSDCHIEAVLLKGAAYLAAGLPFVRGRNMRDLDLMVRPAQLAAAEQALRAAGLQTGVQDSYDQHYYRTWMHEIPPLRHPARGIEVDLHHRILPLTARLQPDPELLWADSVPLPERPGLRVLSPTDMLLHTATHLFQDGEIQGGFGDLLDIDTLITTYGGHPDYWSRLLARADRLQLGRPLYYALFFARRLLGSPVPAAILDESRTRGGPGAPTGALMTRLVTRVLPPQPPGMGPAPFSAWLLYVRSHWLRMPPVLLARHLSRKALRRVTS